MKGSLLIAIGLCSLFAAGVISTPSVVINEIAWGGSPSNPKAEWIELLNGSGSEIDLAGWRLISSDGAPNISLSGRIAPLGEEEPKAGYFLLVRKGGEIPGLEADLAYSGALTDRPDNWATCNCTDEDRSGICGTPKRENSRFNLPPTAAIAITPAYPSPGEEVVFNAGPSSDMNDSIASYTWDFGDGTTDERETVTHTYSTPGVYIVALTVTDERGTSATQTDSISIASLPPEAEFTVEPAVPTAGQPAEFDASGSSDPDGKVTGYHWDFDGNGTVDLETEGSSVTHTYQTGGTVLATLSVIDDNGDLSAPFRAEIRVNSPPVAGFRASTFSPMELEEVGFTDCSYDADGTIVGWEWDFGDGATSCQTSPKHAFRSDGDYTVSLTVVDDDGGRGTTEAKVTVGNLPPLASLSVNCAAQPTGSEFKFDASSSHDQSPDGKIVRYEWDLNDNGTFDLETTSPTLSHTYADDGSYRVRIRVTDDDGASATSDPVTVTVENRPAAIGRIDRTPLHPTDGEAVMFTPTATDPDGLIVGWLWDFGDGEMADSQTASHTFRDDGVYRISLTVTDDDGASSTFDAEVTVENSPPIADFTEAANGVKVAFDAGGSYDPSPNGRVAHLAWDFGDGTTCPGDCDGTDRSRPVHTFPGPGSYTVTLVVIDDDGGIDQLTHQIRIGG